MILVDANLPIYAHVASFPPPCVHRPFIVPRWPPPACYDRAYR